MKLPHCTFLGRRTPMKAVAKSPRNWDRVQFLHVDSLIPLARWKKRNWIDLPWRLQLRLLLPVRVYKRRGIVMMLIVMDPLRRLQEFSSVVAHGGMRAWWQTGYPGSLGCTKFSVFPHKYFNNLYFCASRIFTENSKGCFMYYILSYFRISTTFD
jgi:hypothetical protein